MAEVEPIACPNLHLTENWTKGDIFRRLFRSLKPALFRCDYERSDAGSFRAISKSARTGCQSCSLILKGLELCVSPESLRSMLRFSLSSEPCTSEWWSNQGKLCLIFFKTPGKICLSNVTQVLLASPISKQDLNMSCARCRLPPFQTSNLAIIFYMHVFRRPSQQGRSLDSELPTESQTLRLRGGLSFTHSTAGRTHSWKGAGREVG